MDQVSSDQNPSVYKEYFGGCIDALVHVCHSHHSNEFFSQFNIPDERKSMMVVNSHSLSSSYQYFVDFTLNNDNNALSLSISEPLILPDRSTVCTFVSKNENVQFYSGLVNGSVVVTSLENNTTSLKEISNQHTFPISSICVDSYSGTIHVAYEDGLVIRNLNDSSQVVFRPLYGCRTIQSLDNEHLMVTSMQTTHSGCIYDISNECILSLKCPFEHHFFSSSTVHPFNNKEIVFGCSNGMIVGYDLRNPDSFLFSYQAHSASVTDIHYYTNPYPSILSSSLDGTVYQRANTGEGRILISDSGCLYSGLLDPVMGFAAGGGQSGNLVVVHPI